MSQEVAELNRAPMSKSVNLGVRQTPRNKVLIVILNLVHRVMLQLLYCTSAPVVPMCDLAVGHAYRKPARVRVRRVRGAIESCIYE